AAAAPSRASGQSQVPGLRRRYREDDGKSGGRGGMKNLAAIPGVPPLIACFALLVAWEIGARLIALESLPTAWETLRDLPAILTDPRSLYDILSSIRRMAVGFALAFMFAIPVGLMM